jgi:hypothetical protein
LYKVTEMSGAKTYLADGFDEAIFEKRKNNYI